MRVAFIILFGMTTFFCEGKSDPDSIAISKLNSKAYKYFLFKPDSAILLANQAIALAGKRKYLFQIGLGYYIISKANWAKANYLLSIQYGFKALRIYENTDQIFYWGESNLSLARTFADLKIYTQSKIYIDNTYLLARERKNQQLLAEVYREKSFLLAEQAQYDSALYYSYEGIKLYEARKDTLNASILYGRNVRIYLKLKDYKKSFEFDKKAILMDSLSRNRRALGISYYLAAEIYYNIKKKDSALHFLMKSIPLNLQIRNLPYMIKTHSLLSTIYREMNQLPQAITHLQLVNQYKDSLYNLERNGQIQEILARYELDSKEKKITTLENENVLEKQRSFNQQVLSVFLGVVIMLLVLLSFVFWTMRQFQAKANLALAEKNKNIALQNEEIQSQAETLHEINNLKSKLFSVISHDLRGPINNLHSLLDLLTKEHLTPSEFKDVSTKLKASLNISQRTLENLLNWSLSQMEGIRTEKTIFNISSVIVEVANLTEETASKKQVTISNEMKATLLVEADVNQVHLILRNLIHNAIKFSQRNGIVTLVAEKKAKFCYISVQDNGIGITPSEKEMILNSHEYFTKSGTDMEKGTGLGLHLCKDFIRRNGGELSIESEVGKGTLVTICLPLA